MVIYRNATIITVDQGRRIITDGALAEDGGRIAAVDKAAGVLAQYPPGTEQVDLHGGLMLPGLINTHVHLAQCLLRGCADDLPLRQWLTERVWVLQGNYGQEDGRISAELCILEMLKSGTTAFVESFLAGHYGFDGIARAVERSGIRAALSKIVMDLPNYAGAPSSMHPGMIEDPEASFDEALTMHDRWQGAGEGRIQVWFGPRPPDASSTPLYRKMMAAARERGMHVTVHLAEAPDRAAYTRQRYGMSTIEYCESVGMLGPDVLAVHTVYVDPDEIALLARTGTHVSHNPVSNAKLGSGIAPIPEMIRAGVNVGLGTDAAPASNDYDMIRAMRWASYIHKVRLGDPTVSPCEQVLEMATMNGARAMGWEDEIGSLEVGKKADFVVLDMNKPHLTPAFDPVSTVVCAATGKDVAMVVVDGRVVVRDGQALTMDEERILAEARERAASLYGRAKVVLPSRWPLV